MRSTSSAIRYTKEMDITVHSKGSDVIRTIKKPSSDCSSFCRCELTKTCGDRRLKLEGSSRFAYVSKRNRRIEAVKEFIWKQVIGISKKLVQRIEMYVRSEPQ